MPSFSPERARSRHNERVSAFWCEFPRDVLVVTGADALTYLQGQISQDIRELGDGDSAYSLVLQPTGKVDALVRVRRRTAESFEIDTDPGFGDALAARLMRFKIRVKVEIDKVALRAIAVRNSDLTSAEGLPAWGLSDAFDVIGEQVDPPAGIREGSTDQLTAARIEAGWPAMGAEITDATIPAELGRVVALAVSFTKGCYPGQELVERMDSRGSAAPRFVRRLRGAGQAVVAAGDDIVHLGKTVGSVTSLGGQDSAAGWAALGVVARSIQPGDTVSIRDTDAVVEDAVAEDAVAEDAVAEDAVVGPA